MRNPAKGRIGHEVTVPLRFAPVLPRVLAALIALVLVVSPLGSLHARSAPQGAATAQRVRLAIDADKLGDEAERTRHAVLPAVESALREADLMLDEGAGTELRIVVRYMEADSRHDYLFRFDIAHEGTLAPNSPAFHCLDCVTADLTERIVSELPIALALLVPTDEDEPIEPVETAPSSPTTDHATRRVRPLGPLGKASIGLLAAGLVGAGVGVGLIVRGHEIDARAEHERVDFRPAGYATLGVSAALLITGAVLFAIDRRRARRMVTAAPTLAPQSAGLTMTGRF